MPATLAGSPERRATPASPAFSARIQRRGGGAARVHVERVHESGAALLELFDVEAVGAVEALAGLEPEPE